MLFAVYAPALGARMFFPPGDYTIAVFSDVERVVYKKGSARQIVGRLLAGDRGFEPRLTNSESAVLPLDQSPTWGDFTIVMGECSTEMLRDQFVRGFEE